MNDIGVISRSSNAKDSRLWGKIYRKYLEYLKPVKKPSAKG
jgi:hypothetical protein